MSSDEDLEQEIEFSDADDSQNQGDNVVQNSGLLQSLKANLLNNETFDKEKALQESKAKNSREKSAQPKSNQKKIKLEMDIREEYKDYKILHPYSCKLNTTDVSSSDQSVFRYYSQQLLEKEGEHCGVLSIWGKVGLEASSSFNYFELEDRQLSVQRFKEIFEEKTMNKWEDKDNFKPQIGAYNLLGAATGRMSDEDQHFKTQKDKKLLEEKLQMIFERWDFSENKDGLGYDIIEILRHIFDKDKLLEMLREISVDIKKIHFSQITTERVNKCFNLLGKVQEELLRKHRRTRQLLEICGELNDVIPQCLRDNRQDDFQTLKERVIIYQRLRAAECFNNLLRSLDVNEDEIYNNTAVKVYKSLNCGIKRLNYKDDKFSMISNSLTTHGHTHGGFRLVLREAFDLQKDGEMEKFYPFVKLPMRKMLWHAGSAPQILSYLKNGIQTPIAGAPSVGYMFGKGMYFTDVVSKAASLSFTPRVDRTCVQLLCDVAVGEEHRLVKPKVLNRAPKPNHSVVGIGKYAPANYEEMDGSRLYIGEPIENKLILNSLQCNESSFMYNEYVVYDVGQVRMAYLVLCDIDYYQVNNTD